MKEVYISSVSRVVIRCIIAFVGVTIFGSYTTYAATTLYATAKSATPVFRKSDFPRYFSGTLLLDSYQQIDPLEFVAPPGSWFEVVSAYKQSNGHRVLGVNSDFYPIKGGKIYIDSRFINFTFTKPTYHIPKLSKTQIYERLDSMIGLPYVRGSNRPWGIWQMSSFYPPNTTLSLSMSQKRSLQGVDCSGLLRYANGGITPKNTKDIARFGDGLPVAGKSMNEILDIIQPLDVIVRPGHMMIVYDKDRTIESNIDYEPRTPGFQGGVRVRPIRTSLGEVMRSRVPANSLDTIPKGKQGFVIRRRYTE